MRKLILAAGLIAAAVVVSTVHAEGDEDCVPKKPYVVKTFNIHERGDLPDVKLSDATVSLIGEPGSKSFGLSYRGTLSPQVEMTGDEKLVAYLYINCDDKIPSKTAGINVGTVNIGTLKRGREVSTVIATADASAFVPLRNIECAKIDIN